MSFRALVIPEDPTYNGIILKPLVERLLRECGRSQAKVDVLTDAKVRGYEAAVRSMPRIALKYRRIYDVLFFLPDADGRGEARQDSLNRLEENERAESGTLICCAAKEEVEVWALAGYRDKLRHSWADVRAEVSVKELVFRPFARQLGLHNREDEGRAVLISETLRNYRALTTLCPELAQLEDRVRAIPS